MDPKSQVSLRSVSLWTGLQHWLAKTWFSFHILLSIWVGARTSSNVGTCTLTWDNCCFEMNCVDTVVMSRVTIVTPRCGLKWQLWLRGLGLLKIQKVACEIKGYVFSAVKAEIQPSMLKFFSDSNINALYRNMNAPYRNLNAIYRKVKSNGMHSAQPRLRFSHVFQTQIKMLCCLFQCFKLGFKQRRLAMLAFVIFAGLLLIIQTTPPNSPTQTKSRENVKILGPKKRGRHLNGDEKEDEDDIRRNAKQETIRMLRQFAKGLHWHISVDWKFSAEQSLFSSKILEWLTLSSEPGQHFRGRKKRLAEIFQHRTDRFKKVNSASLETANVQLDANLNFHY